EQGDVPKSRDLVGVMPLWVIFLYLSFGGFMFTTLVSYLRTALKRGFEVPLTESSFIAVFRGDSIKALIMMAPLFVSLLLAVASVHFMQTGFLLTTKPLTPDLTRLSPM